MQQLSLFPEDQDQSYSIQTIDFHQAKEFLLPRHYSGRIPRINTAFALMQGSKIRAVLSIGRPASPQVCRGVLGDDYKDSVYELNRLCTDGEDMPPLSQFVAACLRRLKSRDLILVSYADTAMNHHGYIYQATNWIYTGATKKRRERRGNNGSHARHYDKSNPLVFRSVKHRYIFFCTNKKSLRKRWTKNMRWPVEPYPKGDNSRYVLLCDRS